MVIKEEIYIDIYDCYRTLHIYLPPTIKEKPAGVLYMFDGHNLFDDNEATYGCSWDLANYCDSHNVNLIIVGLECNHEGNLRLGEFSPYSFFDNYWGEVQASGKPLANWFVNYLKPYIDQHYNTIPDRLHTGIGGSSMGGLMALYMGACYSNIYSKTIAISNFYDHVFKELSKDINTKLYPDSYFYISFGGKETGSKRYGINYIDQQLKVVHILKKHGADVDLYMYKNGIHSESCWRNETKTWMKLSGLDKLQ